MTRTPPTPCPYCARTIDVSVNAAAPEEKPGPGAISLCLHCGEWVIVTKHMTLRKPTEVEQIAIGHMSEAIRARKAWDTVQLIFKESGL